MGLRLVLKGGWLTVHLDNEFWLGQRAQALRNLGPHFAPFPFGRFDVRVGDRPATRQELERLGDTFLAHAS